MHYKLIYENHQHYGLHVADIFLMLKYGLESLGHTADIEHNFMPGYMNIMLECFDDDFIQKLNKSWNSKTGLIVIATEFLTGKTFNNIYNDPNDLKGKKDHNLRKDYWQKRYDDFTRVLPYMSAIWHPARQQVPYYQQRFPDHKVLYIPHVYSSRFATVKQRSNQYKDIDILFTGSMTSYRKEVIDSLEKEGLKVVTSSLFTAPFHREDLISRSKIVLNIKQHDNWEHESVGRLHYHVSNDSLIVTDKCKYPTDIHNFVCEVSDSWLQTVMNQLHLGHYNERAAKLRKQFSLQQPAEVLFQQLIKESNL